MPTEFLNYDSKEITDTVMFLNSSEPDKIYTNRENRYRRL